MRSDAVAAIPARLADKDDVSRHPPPFPSADFRTEDANWTQPNVRALLDKLICSYSVGRDPVNGPEPTVWLRRCPVGPATHGTGIGCRRRRSRVARISASQWVRSGAMASNITRRTWLHHWSIVSMCWVGRPEFAVLAMPAAPSTRTCRRGGARAVPEAPHRLSADTTCDCAQSPGVRAPIRSKTARR